MRNRTDPRTAACLLAAVLVCAPGFAAGTAPAQPADTTECKPESETRETWIDRAHDYLTGKVCAPVEWFDSFVGEERADEENRAGSYLRVKLGARWRDQEGWDVPVETYMSVKLPKASDRLRLLLFSQNKDDLREDPSDPGFIAEGEENTQLGVRYEAIKGPRSNLSFTGTTSPKAEARYRYEHPVNARTLARFTQTAFWSDNDGFGGLTRGDIEHRFSPSVLSRFTAWGKYCDNCDDVEWRTEYSVFQRISPKAAAEYKAIAYGDTASGHVEEYRLRANYRRNFYRPWLFWDLQPELRWPLREGEDRDTEPRVTLYLEMQFAGGRGYTYR